MKNWIFILFFISVPALSQELISLDSLLSAKDLKSPEFLVNERLFIEHANQLPDNDYYATLQEIGRHASAQPAAVSHLLARLQKQCEKDRDVEQISHREQKTGTQLLALASYQLAEDFLSDINADGRYLPEILAAHREQNIQSSARQCPYELLYSLAAPKDRMEESVAREESAALNGMMVDAASAAPLAITVANLAFRIGALGAPVSEAAPHLLIGTIASLTVYQILQSYSQTLVEGRLLSDYNRVKSQLRTAIQSGPAGSITPLSQRLNRAAMNLYAHYSFDLIVANRASNPQDPNSNRQIRNAYMNSCQTSIDKRFLFEALKARNQRATLNVLRNSTCETKREFVLMLVSWNSDRGFRNIDELRPVRADFIQSSSARRDRFIESEEKKLQESWEPCADPLYFLFTVADDLDKLSTGHAGIFDSQPALQETKELIDHKILATARVRRDVLSSMPSASNTCTFPAAD